ncbi:PH domain-containing protein [Canibacter sp. lx-72]|uniref:PH domain-containing protein n=1 Tax=Canibacter zhuwentaonis TaxID=2837491 RepID=UPI001BDDC366|nr:PH domain-containing protein [Canibacter zhuwentaonis]MBT1018353.1 PH domain-containing protein [Canibacter zhuwentaonis]MBT1035541.1 PH domain-containing protein [Canibacter zhuwentaonis]
MSTESYERNRVYRISKKYLFVDLTISLIALLLEIIAGLFLAHYELIHMLFVAIVYWFIVGATILGALLSWRRIISIGYALRDDDFLFFQGFLFHKMTAVPYGRLQLVEIKRGPIMRIFNLSSLQFVTAAATANVNLPGLKQAHAEQLRDELMRLAKDRRSDL